MKDTLTLFALIFFLVAITTHLPSATATSQLLDIQGYPLRNGGTYYIFPWPLGRGFGGGIELAQTGNDTCPLTIVKSRFDSYPGIPVTITSPFRIAYIHDQIPVELELRDTSLPSCTPTPPIWNVVKDELTDDGWAIKLNDDDSKQRTQWFFIEYVEYGDARHFQIKFNSVDNNITGYVGLDFGSDGVRRLVLTKEYPYLVQFSSADDSSFAA